MMTHSAAGHVRKFLVLAGFALGATPVMFSLTATPRGADLARFGPFVVLPALILLAAVILIRLLDGHDRRQGLRATRKCSVRNVPTALTYVHDETGSRNA